MCTVCDTDSILYYWNEHFLNLYVFTICEEEQVQVVRICDKNVYVSLGGVVENMSMSEPPPICALTCGKKQMQYNFGIN